METTLQQTTKPANENIVGNLSVSGCPAEPSRGVAIISHITNRIDSFITRKRTKTEEKKLFNHLFKDDGEHLLSKNWKSDFGGFFLNLDNKNTNALLRFLSDEIELTYPDIPNWMELGKKYGMDRWEEFTQEDVRTCAVGFTDVNEWDAYPHDIVWLRRFILYALNHSVSDKDFEIEHENKLFGNYKNWSFYYNWLGVYSQLTFVKTLVDYK